MPTVDENIEKWDDPSAWSDCGDEWSAAWGGPAMQWFGSLLPRIHHFVPADNILEIACGYGRWTQYLQNLCEHLDAIDISDKCIESCKQRFAHSTHLKFHVNDGKSLAIVPDCSIDFVFSFDSLVHADTSVLEAYISQLPRLLKPDGAAFFHHSNLGSYARQIAAIDHVPKLQGALARLGVWDKNYHWRDPGVSAKSVKAQVEAHGLVCASQEIVHWGTRKLNIDCFTTIVTKNSRYQRTPEVFVNKHFMDEARNLRRLARLYQRDAEHHNSDT